MRDPLRDQLRDPVIGQMAATIAAGLVPAVGANLTPETFHKVAADSLQIAWEIESQIANDHREYEAALGKGTRPIEHRGDEDGL
jgi:hypothetical protein